MEARVKPKRETWAGVTMIGIGLIVIFESMSYNIGDAARMGPGYFPLLLGILLSVLGVIIALSTDPEEDEKFEAAAAAPKALETAEAANSPDGAHEEPVQQTRRIDRLRGMACIIGGILAFMLVGRYGGLVPATFVLVFISALGDVNNRLPSALILAAVVTVFGTLIFHWGLQLQFPLFRWG